MVNREILALIEEYRDRALGWKLSGAGGGGYLILVPIAIFRAHARPDPSKRHCLTLRAAPSRGQPHAFLTSVRTIP